jgi:NAD kinase
MKKIWIFSPNQESRTQERKSIFESQLKKLGIEVETQAKIDTDLALCIGGDGSLLSMIRNLGSLRPIFFIQLMVQFV